MPTRSTILAIHQKAIESGDLCDRSRSGRPRSVRSPTNVTAVLEAYGDSPTMSTRQASAQIGVSQRTIQRILHAEGLHPYKLQLLQEISDEDCADRLTFCEEMLNAVQHDESLLSHILWTDEAHFHLSGEVNRHNCRYWSKENPEYTSSAPLHSPKTTVWCGIWSGGIVGPIFFDATVTGISYLSMLKEHLLPRLQKISQFTSGQLWFMHDGAPPHWSTAVRNWLNDIFDQQWIGRGGPMSWPARSPDLTPCDFYLWGDLKRRVYSCKVTSITQLKQRIIAEIAMTSHEALQAAVSTHLAKRLQLCAKRNGGHIENAL